MHLARNIIASAVVALCSANLSAAETAAGTANFVIASGSEGGKYEHTAKIVADSIEAQAKRHKANLKTSVINTNGSLENIDLLNDGEVQAALVQADVLNIRPPSTPIRSKSAYQEYVMWVYNKENGFNDLEDIEGSNKNLMVIVEDSGADVTMQSFVSEDKGYQINYENAVFVDDLYDAFDLVSEGKHQGKPLAGLLYVGGKIPAEMVEDFKDRVAVGSATDGDFNDATDVSGNPLYSNCEVGKAQAQGLLEGWGSPNTVCVSAMFIYANSFDDKKQKKAVNRGVQKGLRAL